MIKSEIELRRRILTMEITSPVFKSGGNLPRKHTCDGENISPELHFNKIPIETKSLVLILDDPDAPVSTWTHWLVWNILPQKSIGENYKEGVFGKNDFGTIKYSGPCPPYGTHTYYFRIYALDSILDMAEGSTRFNLDKIIPMHVLAYAEIKCRYKKEK